MKVIDPQELKPPYDVASGLAETLIAAGLAKKYEPLIPAKMPQTAWQATEGFRMEDDVESPIIRYSCASCGLKGQMSGPNCETTQKLHHCNSVEAVPGDVQRTFRTLRIAWERTHKRRSGNPLFGAPSYGYTVLPGSNGKLAAHQVPMPTHRGVITDKRK
jgi:hypothetical protein